MKKYHILIVDDDQAIAEPLKQWLEMNGFQVTTALNADDETWISQWQWREFDCIITGINQPGLDGLSFTELIRDTGGPPVIVMSGFEPEVSKVKALDRGAFAFLKKPFDFLKLLEIVEDCCAEGI